MIVVFFLFLEYTVAVVASAVACIIQRVPIRCFNSVAIKLEIQSHVGSPWRAVMKCGTLFIYLFERGMPLTKGILMTNLGALKV